MRIVHQLLALPSFLAGLKFACAGSHNVPAAFVHAEEQRAPRRHLDLRIKSRTVQIFPALKKFFVQPIALRKRVLVKRRRHLMQTVVERVHQNQAVLREKARKKFAEGAAVRFFRPVTFHQVLRDQVAALVRQQLRGFPHKRLDLCAERNLSHWPRCLRHLGQFKTHQFSLVEPSCVPDLVEIVVFRGHPKDRHGRSSAARQLLCDLNGGQRLINGIRRPAE